MNKQVEAYLLRKRNEFEEEQSNIRNEHLKSLGLTKKVYTDKSRYSDEFPRYDNKEKKFYKVIALDVTEEEYEEICKCEDICKHDTKKEVVKSEEGTSSITTVMNALAVIIIVGGIIAGFIVGHQDTVYRPSEHYMNNDFQWRIALAWWFYSVVIGVMFFGFSIVINLLEKINMKLNN